MGISIIYRLKEKWILIRCKNKLKVNGTNLKIVGYKIVLHTCKLNYTPVNKNRNFTQKTRFLYDYSFLIQFISTSLSNYQRKGFCY